MVNDIMVSLVVTLKDIEYVKTHFSRMFHLYSPWKDQKPLVFRRFQGV